MSNKHNRNQSQKEAPVQTQNIEKELDANVAQPASVSNTRIDPENLDLSNSALKEIQPPGNIVGGPDVVLGKLEGDVKYEIGEADEETAAEDQSFPAQELVEEPPVESVPEVKEEAPVQRFESETSPTTSAFVTIGTIIAIQELEEYIEIMGQRIAPAPDDGASRQSQLFRALLSVLKSEDVDFRPAMDRVLEEFRTHKDDVLGAAKVYRFVSQMKARTPQDIETFKALVNMFQVMAVDPKARQLAIKQVDFDSTLNTPHITEQQRQRVYGYFGVK